MLISFAFDVRLFKLFFLLESVIKLWNWNGIELKRWEEARMKVKREKVVQFLDFAKGVNTYWVIH